MGKTIGICLVLSVILVGVLLPAQMIGAQEPRKVAATPSFEDIRNIFRPRRTTTPWPTKAPNARPTNTPWPTKAPNARPTNTPWPTKAPNIRPMNTPWPTSSYKVPVATQAPVQPPASPTQSPVVTAVPSESLECGGENLLYNPSFEGEYTTYDPNPRPAWVDANCLWGPCRTAQMAAGWEPFWQVRQKGVEEGWQHNMPEYKPATSDLVDPPRVRSGERAQQWFTFYSTHNAGIMQRVTGLTPGRNYCASVWGHSWTTHSDSTKTDVANNGNFIMMIGVDPNGSKDWSGPSVVWTEPRQVFDKYQLFKIYFTAQSGSATFYMRSQNEFPGKHNDVYWDDAKLSVLP